MFVDVADLSEITVLKHPANLTWQKLNIWVNWEAVGVAADIKGVLYLKLQVKKEEVKSCFLSSDAAHTLLECSIVLLSKASPLFCFQLWQLKLTKERFLRKKASRFIHCLRSQPGAAVTVLGHSKIEWMRDGLRGTHVPAPYGQGQFIESHFRYQISKHDSSFSLFAGFLELLWMTFETTYLVVYVWISVHFSAIFAKTSSFFWQQPSLSPISLCVPFLVSPTVLIFLLLTFFFWFLLQFTVILFLAGII